MAVGRISVLACLPWAAIASAFEQQRSCGRGRSDGCAAQLLERDPEYLSLYRLDGRLHTALAFGS
jgi:hypothetical protein